MYDDFGVDDYYETHEQDDLRDLGDREAWEDAQAEMRDLYDDDEDFEDDIDGDFYEPAEDSYLDTAYEDRTDFDYPDFF